MTARTGRCFQFTPSGAQCAPLRHHGATCRLGRARLASAAKSNEAKPNVLVGAVSDRPHRRPLSIYSIGSTLCSPTKRMDFTWVEWGNITHILIGAVSDHPHEKDAQWASYGLNGLCWVSDIRFQPNLHTHHSKLITMHYALTPGSSSVSVPVSTSSSAWQPSGSVV